jgi:hypothetical protein
MSDISSVLLGAEQKVFISEGENNLMAAVIRDLFDEKSDTKGNSFLLIWLSRGILANSKQLVVDSQGSLYANYSQFFHVKQNSIKTPVGVHLERLYCAHKKVKNCKVVWSCHQTTTMASKLLHHIRDVYASTDTYQVELISSLLKS